MAISDVLEPARNMFGGTLTGLFKYSWVLFPLVIIVAIIGAIFLYKTFKKKNSQWTHKLKVRRVLHVTDNENSKRKILSDPVYIKMRRFPLIKKAEVFELENPLLGGYLLPELDRYSGENEFSIILDTNNRIYTNLGEYFDPDKRCVNVSAKHSEIDIQRANLKADFQNINKVNKRVEWATIAKYAFLTIFVLAVMIVTIVGLTKWGDAQSEKVELQRAQAETMRNINEAMETMEAVVNTQKLEILPLLKEIYGTNNIQGVINKEIGNNE